MTDVASPASPPPPPEAPAPPRRVNRGLLWASGVAVVVLAIATIVAFTAGNGDDGVQQIDPDNPSQLQGRNVTGETVPAETFDRFDGGELTGQKGSLTNYSGQPMVVNFFASWCTPCIEEMPEFERVHQQTGGDVAFVGINTGEQADSGSRIINQTGVTYDILRDPSGTLTQQFDILNMPATLFVDERGTIVKVHTGLLSQAELERIIRDDLHA